MPLQNFVDGSEPTIDAAWLNAIDAFYFTLFNSAGTAAAARTAIGVGTGDSPTFTAVTASGGVFDTGAATNLALRSGGVNILGGLYAASSVNYLRIRPSITGNSPGLETLGSDTNIPFLISTKGTGEFTFYSDTFTNAQFQILYTASASRNVTVTGSNGGNPTIGVTAGSLAITPAIVGAAAVGAFQGTAIPAGGTAGLGFLATSTTNFGIFFGSGVPTLAAAKGSLYLRSDGSTTNDRAYINTNGSTTWTAVITAA